MKVKIYHENVAVFKSIGKPEKVKNDIISYFKRKT